MPLIPRIVRESMRMTQEGLLAKGKVRVAQFCKANSIPLPAINSYSAGEWVVHACAYYRPDTPAMRKWTTPGINICLSACARPAKGDTQVRNWNWPGSTVDREPYGVICHELGHHIDWLTGEQKGTYYSEFSSLLREMSGEEPITNYCDNDAEWFAEMMRVFITNHALLERVRPVTWRLLVERWAPVSSNDWKEELGMGVPARIVRAQQNKMR